MKKKVLYVIGNLYSGGVESFSANILSNISKEDFEIDLAVNSIDKSSVFYENLNKNVAKIYIYGITSNYRTIFLSSWKIWNIMKKGNYDVVHSNINFCNSIVLMLACFAKIKKRISHSHGYLNLQKLKFHVIIRYIIKIPLKPLICFFATKLLATSTESGSFLYGHNSKFDIIKNSISLEHFAFNLQVRNQLCEKNNWQDKFVIGHVGRFSMEKNHLFLIDVFNEIYKQKDNVLLILIGDGPKRPQIEKKIQDLKLEKKIKLIGIMADISQLYQAMDCFIFPSINEGFGLVAIEAQCAGLPCFISDGVPDEASVVNTTKIALSKKSKEWANIILQMTENFHRKDCSDIIKEAGFDIKDVVKQIEREYLK